MGYFFPTDFEDVVQRNSLQAAQHSALYPPRDPPFPQPLLFDCFTIYSRLGSNPRPMADKATTLTTELVELPCNPSLFSCNFRLAFPNPPIAAIC